MPAGTRLIGISLLAGSLALLGFGCKKTVAPTPAPTVTPSARTTVQPAPAATAPVPNGNATGSADLTPPDPRIQYLTQVMKNFNAVNSFRTTMLIDNGDVPMRADLESVRWTGIHGVLQVGPTLTSEIILMGSDAYFRSNTSTWINLAKTPEGQQTADALRNAFAVSDDVTSFLKGSTVVSVSADAAGCMLYTLQKTDASGTTKPYSICVSKDLPAAVVFDSPSGHITAAYRDYNQTIQIQAPSLK